MINGRSIHYHSPFSSKLNSGFTLIELLIVFSLMAILMAVGITSYRNFSQRQILVQAAKELKSNLRLIQQKAITGEKENSATSCRGGSAWGDFDDRKLDGWYLTLTGTTGYQYYGQCSQGANTYPFGSTSVDLQARSIAISVSPAGALLRFYPLTKGTAQAVTYTLTAGSQSQQITVSKEGEIK